MRRYTELVWGRNEGWFSVNMMMWKSNEIMIIYNFSTNCCHCFIIKVSDDIQLHVQYMISI